MSEIADLVRREARLFGAGKCTIPGPQPGKRFVRMKCPFCSKDRAWIDHRGGWFRCPHADCGESGEGRTLTTGDNSILRRFAPQISHVADKISDRFTYRTLPNGRNLTWLEAWEARQIASELVLGYAYGRPGDPHDAGRLWDWEIEVKGDPNLLDAHVAKALEGDLHNHARKKARQAAWECYPLIEDSDSDDLVSSARRVTRPAPDDYESLPERRLPLDRPEPLQDVQDMRRSEQVWDGTAEIRHASDPDAGTAVPRTPSRTVKDAEGGDLDGYPILSAKYHDNAKATNAELAGSFGMKLRTFERALAEERQRWIAEHPDQVERWKRRQAV